VSEKLVEDPEGFEKWLAEMVAATKPLACVATDAAGREGNPEAYVASVLEPPALAGAPKGGSVLPGLDSSA
jgi:hypothetical protein